MSLFSSLVGRAGCSRFPKGVHFANTASPNSASRASLTARVPAFDSPFNLGYLSRTVDTGINLLPLISVEGSAFDAALTGKGFLGTPCCIGLLAVVGVGRVGVVGAGRVGVVGASGV